MDDGKTFAFTIPEDAWGNWGWEVNGEKVYVVPAGEWEPVMDKTGMCSIILRDLGEIRLEEWNDEVWEHITERYAAGQTFVLRIEYRG